MKPANVLLSDSGQIKLGDFGLARLLTAEDRVTTGGDVMGTAAYFSPEQAAAREVGPAADIYSLGLVLLECLTGRREFPGDAVPAAVARLLRDPVVPTDLPSPWPALLVAMTDSVPAVRPTAAQLVDTLAATPSNETGSVPFASSPLSSAPLSSAPPGQVSSSHLPRADVPLGGAGSGPLGVDATTTESAGESATDAWSSPLSPFLTPATPPVRRSGRRGRVLLGAGAVVAALAVTGAVMMGRPDASPPPANSPTTGLVSGVVPSASSGSTVSSPTGMSRSTVLRSAVSRSSANRTSGGSGSSATRRPPSSVGVTPAPTTPATPVPTSTVPIVVANTRQPSVPAAPPAPTRATGSVTSSVVSATTKASGKSNGKGNGKGQTKAPKKPKG